MTTLRRSSDPRGRVSPCLGRPVSSCRDVMAAARPGVGCGTRGRALDEATPSRAVAEKFLIEEAQL